MTMILRCLARRPSALQSLAAASRVCDENGQNGAPSKASKAFTASKARLTPAYP